MVYLEFDTIGTLAFLGNERAMMNAIKSAIVIHSPINKSTKLKLTQIAKLIIATAMPNAGNHLIWSGILRTAQAANNTNNPVKTNRKIEKNEWVAVATPSGNKAVTINETAIRIPLQIEAQTKKLVFLSFELHEYIPAKNMMRIRLVITPPIL